MDVPSDMELQHLASSAVSILQETRLSLTLAESCTGGYVSKLFTDISGVSHIFYGGYVSYANEAKERMLGVDRDILEEYGAVSRPVVEAMATGALRLSNADIAYSVSGIAGPGGGGVNKPVGMVAFGEAYNRKAQKWFMPDGVAHLNVKNNSMPTGMGPEKETAYHQSQILYFNRSGSRDDIRRWAAKHIINKIITIVNKAE